MPGTTPHPPDRRSVLLTGFAPFPGQPFNVTTRLAPALAQLAMRAFPDLTVHAETLPTEWHGAPARLAQLLTRHRPGLSLHFGIAGRARGFEIETRGCNRRADLDDAAGLPPTSGWIEHAGPAMRRVPLPADLIAARLRRRDIPARASQDAGRYVCNALLYTGLSLAQDHSCRLGFIHLPAELAPDGHRRNGVQLTSPLTWPQALLGGLEIIGGCLGRPVPAHISLSLSRQQAPAARRPSRRRG